MSRTAGQLATVIKKMCAMDVAELGDVDSTQNTYIYDYMSRALKELASLAYVVKITDSLNIVADGFITFTLAGSNITDLYEPIRIVDSNGNEVLKRTFFSAPKGWWRESANSPFHVKGLSGNYVLHYKAYPTEITYDNQIPDFPESGYMVLCYYTAGMIKESKNFYEESAAMYSKAKERMKLLVKANEDGRGTMGGRPPMVSDIDLYFKG
jgi:hypothetical protein